MDYTQVGKGNLACSPARTPPGRPEYSHSTLECRREGSALAHPTAMYLYPREQDIDNLQQRVG